MSNRYHKTRLAPTPSGYLHLGNVLSFVITAALAEKTGAQILLRIDDLDRERSNPSYVQDIFDTLNFLEIPWQEGPRNFDDYEQRWSQLHRLNLYQEALEKLKQADTLFACTCSRARLNDLPPGGNCQCFTRSLSLDTPNAVWRLKTEQQRLLCVEDIFGNEIKATLPADMHNFVVRKKDGYPAYQLTSVVDDMFYGIDLIVRGHDLWPSTMAQLYLAPLMGADQFLDASFYHHPLLFNGEKKLSKSAGAESIQYLRKQSASPAVIYSTVAEKLGYTSAIINWQELAELVI